MDKNEVNVDQVFKDGDKRVAAPYFKVVKVGKTHATGTRSIDFEGTKGYAGKAPATVKIRLDRLVKTGTRGYNLVKGAEKPQAETPAPTPAPEATAPVPETPVEAPKTEAAPV